MVRALDTLRAGIWVSSTRSSVRSPRPSRARRISRSSSVSAPSSKVIYAISSGLSTVSAVTVSCRSGSCGGSGTSSRAASTCTGRGSGRLTRPGSSCSYSHKMSQPDRTSLASPRWMSRLVPRLMGASALPGTAKASRPWSRARRMVIRVPLCSSASTAATPRDRPLIIRLRMGKCSPLFSVPGGYSEMRAPAAATSS